MRCPTDAAADESFRELKETPSALLWKRGIWNTRSSCPKKLDIYIDISKVGSESSNRFHWNTRMACDSLASPSPSRSWFDRKIRKSVEASQYYKDNPKVALSMRKYICATFRPSAAKAIYDAFSAESVYDPCGGWGDRLSAAMSLGIRYHCRDVNPLVFPAYSEQVYRYADESKFDSYTFELRGSEVDAPQIGEFDLCFTSPPYYKIEKYQGNGQSHEYKGMFAWLTEFLFPMFSNAFSVLKNNGHFVINLSDCYADHTMNKLVDPLIRFATTNLVNCNYIGAFGYRIQSRVNYRNQIDGVNAEPVLIFSKGESDIIQRISSRIDKISGAML